MTIRIGISPLTWTNDDLPALGGHIPFEECVSEMAQAGFSGCEIGSKFPKDTKAIKAVLEPLGLAVAASWFSAYLAHGDRLSETLDRFDNHLRFLKACGARVVNVCECTDAIQQSEAPILGHSKPKLTSAQWERVAMGLNQLGALAKACDMTVAYHPHMGTCIESEDEVVELMQRTNTTVGLLLDTGHAHFANTDSLFLIERFHDRIAHVHLKDIRGNVLEQTRTKDLSFLEAVLLGVFTVPGDGVIDFQPIADALKRYGYQGWFMVEAEQDPSKAHPLTYATRAREYIRQITKI